ncbi:MAG: radical SAM protein [Chloroflexi bacterium]|nr:radical SAM protein [Chloroflexota bacterium]
MKDVPIPPSAPHLPDAYRLSEARGEHVQAQPRCVFIEVTNRCNLACAACVRSVRWPEPPRDLTLDEFDALIEQFPALERAVLHGIGEPLLNRQLPEMIRRLKKRGVTVLFNSNGTLLTPDRQEALALSGLDEYRLSLDSADPRLYESLRGRPLFDRVVRNVREFVATQKRLGVKGPKLSLWCIGMKENIEQLPELVRLAGEIGIAEVYVQRLVYLLDPRQRRGLAGPEQTLFGRLAAREREIVAECARLGKALGIAFRASGATDPDESLSAARKGEERPWRACLRPWTTAYITAQGNALPCCIAPFAATHYDELVLGNIWEKSFVEIWNDAPYRRWRGRLLGDSPPEACSGCGVCWSL